MSTINREILSCFDPDGLYLIADKQDLTNEQLKLLVKQLLRITSNLSMKVNDIITQEMHSHCIASIKERG